MSDATKIDLLVVDDDDEFRDTLVRRFSRCGFAVSDAAGGEEALDMTGRREFDVAVVDMMMPTLSGLELLEKFKESNVECEIIFLTVCTKDGKNASGECASTRLARKCLGKFRSLVCWVLQLSVMLM